MVTTFSNDYWSHCKAVDELLTPVKKVGSSVVFSKAWRSLGWRPPPLNFVKINFDGSRYQDGSAACVFVIRDHKGEVVVSGCNSLPSDCSIIQAEV